jgi:CBS domain-containing protein
MTRVSVREAMTPNVLTVGPDASVARAAKLMAKRSVGSVVVVRSKKPLGILTERDLLMKVLSADLKPSKIPVKKIMSSPVVTITPDTDVTDAARIMARNRIRRLPVVERGELVGILTTMDIMSISPDLLELASGPEVKREEIEESVCESCGEVTTALYEVNGMWVCEDCRDDMTR